VVVAAALVQLEVTLQTKLVVLVEMVLLQVFLALQ
jgi:hypothetical protein